MSTAARASTAGGSSRAAAGAGAAAARKTATRKPTILAAPLNQRRVNVVIPSTGVLLPEQAVEDRADGRFGQDAVLNVPDDPRPVNEKAGRDRPQPVQVRHPGPRVQHE